ncbi:hypothetical protein NAEGRDRAFT_57439 [Naegleria gruberi]|uniref:LEM-like domain-containing protein n=1 Tax=Naegleria gruberi TaxID=5762 RepID=D2V886_NAEGR|nr:uncharacterized protein NAEGRDRAFT_57439 [Naegleria gruberi]EFC47001.1 hypothetical protein NAEGRDRAFT_57439 [Naegleria gruberi]|eukprot:XP_002679745.1 hypothetical protein NAEGRDRAFT_57439 [Naegleria gruberi strain NEG-M]
MSTSNNRASLSNNDEDESPTRLTIKELKSILTEHDVELPAQDKKRDFYVDLYNKHIKSKKRKNDEVNDELSDDENEPEQKKVKSSTEEEPAESSTTTTTTTEEISQPTVEEPKVATPMAEVKAKVQRKTKSFAPSSLEAETPQVKVSDVRRRTVGNRDLQYRQRPARNEINQGLLQTPVSSNRAPPPTPLSPTDSTLVQDIRPSEIDQEQNTLGKVLTSILMASIWALFFFCVYLFLFGQRDPHLPYGGRYCQSEDGLLQLKPRDNCLPCPENGYCSDGRLVLCQKPYVIKNAVCVEDSRITLNALEFITELQNELSSKSGKFICGRAESNSTSLEDIKAKLTVKLAGSGVAVEDVLEQVTKLVKSSPQNFQMNIAPVEGSDKEMIFSLNPTLPFDCRIQKATQENKGVIITILTLAVAILIANFYKNKVEREQNDVEDLFRISITRIREEEEIIVEQLRDELKEKYGHEIDVEKYWSRVEDLLASDSRLSQIPSNSGTAYQWAVATDEQE